MASLRSLLRMSSARSATRMSVRTASTTSSNTPRLVPSTPTSYYSSRGPAAVVSAFRPVFTSSSSSSNRFFATTSSDNDDDNMKQVEQIKDVKKDIVKNKDDSTQDDENTIIKEDELLLTHNKEQLEFKAETKQLLDIVTHSLYTDKEVFLRELISNASDALEKLRHIQSSAHVNTIDSGNDVPLEIRIETDEMNGTITITDTGIGLTRDDMITHLGTIAKSGSKEWIQDMARRSQAGDGGLLDASRGIIGKFGVGFYSAFMVGDKVQVRSKSALKPENETDPLHTPQLWSSTGIGSFEIADLPTDIRQDRGASIVIHLKQDNLQFADETKIEEILKKYSNFVQFPIYLNGTKVNTMEAIWAKDPKEAVDEATYTAFYKFIANAFDEPLDRMHFRADAPLEIKALFFIPSFHSEKYGMGRMEPGVNLYCRKVLIEAKSPDILPDWLRFLKGAVDSEDLPLSISREKAQDSALLAKLRTALTRKFISHLATMAKKQPDVYKDEFYKEYQFFLKEGICQDSEFSEQLAKLLYYETSKTQSGELTSLDEYVSRCKPEQKEIYYLCAPSRELALDSPYLEAFGKAGREVIFVYSAIDDFVMANLNTYEGRQLVSAEKSDIDFGEDDPDKKDKESSQDEKDDADATKSSSSPSRLTEQQAQEFCAWFQTTLGGDKVSKCKTTSRLDSSPAVVTDTESGAMRRMMRLVDTSHEGEMPLPKQQVEINPKHPIIVGINAIREKEPTLARVCVEQVYDNCLVAAGLLDDGRSMLPRLNDILLCVVDGAKTHEAEAPAATAPITEAGAAASSSNGDSDDKSGEKEAATSTSAACSSTGDNGERDKSEEKAAGSSK